MTVCIQALAAHRRACPARPACPPGLARLACLAVLTALAMPVVAQTAIQAAAPTAAGSARPEPTVAVPITPSSTATTVGQTRLDVSGMSVVLSYPSTSPTRTVTMGPFQIQVAADGAPMPGRHPLLVISHGARGSAVADHALVERLVHGGFIVAQPLHRGDHFADDHLDTLSALKARPAELSEVIDALAAHADWGPRVDTRRVAVHGMSAGGATVLALVGGRWRTLDLVRHCLVHADDDEGFCYQGTPGGWPRFQRWLKFQSARFTPDALLPEALTTWHGGHAAPAADARRDPRVASVSVAVPLAAIFSADSLARIGVPVGVVSADQDELLRPRWHAERVLQHVPGARRLQGLDGGGHFDALWPWPASVAQAVASHQARGGLPVPGFDPALRDKAQADIVAFHRRHLALDDARP